MTHTNDISGLPNIIELYTFTTVYKTQSLSGLL